MSSSDQTGFELNPNLDLSNYRGWRRRHPLAEFDQFMSGHEGNLELDDDLLIEIATIDLLQQIGDGNDVRAEAYIEASPRIAKNPDLILDLIDAELCARTDRGQSVSASELESRFPNLKSELSRLIAVHQLEVSSQLEEEQAEFDKQDEIGPFRLTRYLFHERSQMVCHAAHMESGNRSLLVVHDLDGLRLNDQIIDELILHFDEAKQQRVPLLVEPVSFGVTNRHAYMAFQPIQGNLLYDQIENPVDPSVAAKWLLDLALGVDAGINVGIRFCEIDIRDVLIDHLNQPKLLSYALRDHLTFIGSNNNQVRTSADVSTVIRSLGLLLFAMVLGQRDIREVKQHAENGHDPISLTDIDSSISNDLNAIYKCSVNNGKENGYMQLDSLIDDLERFLNGKTVSATKMAKKSGWS